MIDVAAIRQAPSLTISAALPESHGYHVRASSGVERSADALIRFLEFVETDRGRRIRLTWQLDESGRRLRTSGGRDFPAFLTVDDQAPAPVSVGLGYLAEPSKDGSRGDPITPEGLRWLGEYLLSLEPGPGQLVAQEGLDKVRIMAAANNGGGGGDGGGVMSCLSDAAGAGVAVGGAAGAVVGGTAGSGVPGAGTVAGAAAGAAMGGALGGAAGGAVGIGYCVVGPVIGGIWDWLTE